MKAVFLLPAVVGNNALWAAGVTIWTSNNELFAGEELELSKRLHKLARQTGREVVILHRHPLVTSARKVRLYSLRELAWFFLRAAFNQKGTLTNRASCHPWYDGRR